MDQDGREQRDFVIVDRHARLGEAWRRRWDSLRLFTPASYDGLPSMPFPAPPGAYPTKDEMADYLEAYAARCALPLRLKTVERLVRKGSGYVLSGDGWRIEADHVVVATGAFQCPRIPAFASGSTGGSDSSTPHSTGIRASSGTAPSSSWGPATRGPRSPWTWQPATRSGCRALTRAASPRCSGGGRGRLFWWLTTGVFTVDRALGRIRAGAGEAMARLVARDPRAR